MNQCCTECRRGLPTSAFSVDGRGQGLRNVPREALHKKCDECRRKTRTGNKSVKVRRAKNLKWALEIIAKSFADPVAAISDYVNSEQQRRDQTDEMVMAQVGRPLAGIVHRLKGKLTETEVVEALKRLQSSGRVGKSMQEVFNSDCEAVGVLEMYIVWPKASPLPA